MSAPLNTHFSSPRHHQQSGMTLVEVLVSVLILAVGLLGAAVIQLNALKYTDSSRMTSQASFIAYDMLDRVRANSGADYTWNQAGSASPGTAGASVRALDLHDFEANIAGFAGAGGKGSVAVSGSEVTVSISWDDARGANTPAARETFSLTSRIASDSEGGQ
ncbi:type IV pilus modification protein PilV [Pseudomonas sp. B22129]|uniref:type IV pilus modification protein PilV n=1 Tax=Pseudomonas sp. B22129 TaxID=3235111 RepID=UPI0037841BD7